MDAVDRVLSGDVSALARAISVVEENAPGSTAMLRGVFPHTGRADVIGVTGSPGSGKSSLVGRLVAAFRAQGKRVGVVAVDPSSAYSGGAILGDRVRMQAHAVDDGVSSARWRPRPPGGLSRRIRRRGSHGAAGYTLIVRELWSRTRRVEIRARRTRVRLSFPDGDDIKRQGGHPRIATGRDQQADRRARTKWPPARRDDGAGSHGASCGLRSSALARAARDRSARTA